MSHNVINRGPRDFTCTICEQVWVSKPRSSCPGVKVYGYGRWDHLMTKSQLGAAGYSTGKTLPKPVGCYRRVMEGDYVMLYDPQQAQKKAPRSTPRTTYYLAAVFWPKSCLPLLDEYGQIVDAKADVLDLDRRSQLQREISNMAVHLGCFDEQESKVEGVLLKITPAMVVHRRYENRFWDERQTLVKRLLSAYKQYIYVPPPPPSAEELERRRLRKEELARENAARTAEVRAKLFDRVPWMTDDEGLPPAVQKSMFDDGEV